MKADLKDNTPKYILTYLNKFQKEEIVKDESVEVIAARFLANHKAAFLELSK